LHEHDQLFEAVLIGCQWLDGVVKAVRVLEQLHFFAVALGLQEELPGSHQLLIKIDLLKFSDQGLGH